MKLRLQKRLSSKVAKAGKDRIRFDSESLDDIKAAITKADIRELMKDGAIKILPKTGTSRHRARERHLQRKKGRQSGASKKKGKAGARTPRKRTWINKIRLQRSILKKLRDKKTLDPRTYRELYMKAKGGFFRNRKHLLLYLKQQGYLKEAKKW